MTKDERQSKHKAELIIKRPDSKLKKIIQIMFQTVKVDELLNSKRIGNAWFKIVENQKI